MTLYSYSKPRPETEREKLRRLFPDLQKDYPKTSVKIEYDMIGNIIKLKTEDKKLQKIMKDEGFTETS
jgi:hypothetical protein